MGQAVTLLFAVLLLGGGPVAEEVDDPIDPEAGLEVDPPSLGLQASSTPVTEEDGLGVDDATDAEPDTSVQARLSAGEEHVEVAADPAGGDVSASATPIDANVRLADGQIVELTYTQPSPAEELFEETPDLPVDEQDALTQGQTEASASPQEDGSEAVTWTLAPAAGLAAIAAAGYVAPTGSWLRRLLPVAPLAPLYSRISSQDALEHPSREAIYELLEEAAGLSLVAICERLDLARSTARHHVRKLEQAGMIDHLNVGRARIHHRVGHRQRALRDHLLSNETRASVLEAIEDRAGTISEIAETIEANPGSVHFHLGKLEEAGLVETVDEAGRKYTAKPVPEGSEAVFEPL